MQKFRYRRPPAAPRRISVRYQPFIACCLFMTLAAPQAKAQSVHFITENYPPYSFVEDKVHKGATTDQIREIMAGTGVDVVFDVMPWARAYAVALSQPLNCIYAAAHTEERHPKFRWIEPLLIDHTFLIARKGSQIHPATLDAARLLTVGSHRGDYTEDLLKRHKFEKIDVSSDLTATLKKLLSGRIDLMAMSEEMFEKMRRDGAAIETVLPLGEETFAIACNADFPADLAAKMQENLNAMIASGRQKKIFLEYGLIFAP